MTKIGNFTCKCSDRNNEEDCALPIESCKRSLFVQRLLEVVAASLLPRVPDLEVYICFPQPLDWRDDLTLPENGGYVWSRIEDWLQLSKNSLFSHSFYATPGRLAVVHHYRSNSAPGLRFFLSRNSPLCISSPQPENVI